LGYNYRISELHAAVGLAQLKRLDSFLEIQKRNYTIIKKALQSVPDILFRMVPEKGVENYSFLSFFLPTEELAKKVHQAFSDGGVDASFYWYDNNWHYHRKWAHLKHLKTLSYLPAKVYDFLPNYDKADFSQSDHWMGRNISCLIKLGWSREEVEERAGKMRSILLEELNKVGPF
jgi:8-amino-3,8-dideoxy-alpha-D-manno-octulosonate transaminase